MCNGGKAIVVAADRMMTYGAPMSLQTEPPVKKIFPLTKTAALLFSGSVPDGEDVANGVKAKIAGVHQQPISTIAEYTKTAYVELKKKRVEEQILRPLLGVDFAGFQPLVAQSTASQILATSWGSSGSIISNLISS